MKKHGALKLISITSVTAGHKVVGIKLQSIGMELATAAELDYEVPMLNVQTAFLNADVKEGVSVKMAPDYKSNDKAGVPLLMKLKKSLYGLR